MKAKFLWIVAGALLLSSCASTLEQDEQTDTLNESQTEVAPATLRISMNIDKNDKTVRADFKTQLA